MFKINKSVSQVAHAVVLIFLCYIIVILKIDTYHVRWWDESNYAVNTYEMWKNGKYFSLYFNGVPDFFNSKPPMLIWMQLFFVKLFGFNELAIRLPSVIAACLTIMVVFIYIAKRFGLILAWLSALILLTSPGFVGFHTARTGDSDALVTLFMVAAAFCFLTYVYENRGTAVFFFFLFTTLAFLTKMYVALFPLPAYFIILLQHRKLRAILTNRFFILGAAFFIAACGTLLYLREQETPGYLNVVFFKEGGRFFQVIEEHNNSWDFYLDNLYLARFAPWFIPLIVGFIFVVLKRGEPDKKMFRDFTWITLSIFLIITLASTKLYWYDTPLFPFMSIIAAFGIHSIFEKHSYFANNGGIRTVLMITLIVVYPFYTGFRSSQLNQIPEGEQKLEAKEKYLFKKIWSNENLNGLKVYYAHWPGSLLFYKYKLRENNELIELTSKNEFSSGDRVLVSQDSLLNLLALKYDISLLDSAKNVRLVQIREKSGL